MQQPGPDDGRNRSHFSWHGPQPAGVPAGKTPSWQPRLLTLCCLPALQVAVAASDSGPARGQAGGASCVWHWLINNNGMQAALPAISRAELQ